MSRPLEQAQAFVDFVNSSPTPYHAVSTVKDMLTNAGFQELAERNQWDLSRGGKFFVTRNGSSLIAFTVGDSFKDGNGISIVGAHTDSPCLRIKPISKKNAEGFIQVGVEQYGGLIAHTWFDRDLSVAGRVYVNHEGQYLPHLVKIDRPLLRIPTLAIHLDRGTSNKFEFNQETKLVPIAGQTALDKNEKTKEGSKCCDNPDLQMSPDQFVSVQTVIQRHSQSLIEAIAGELNVEPSQIEDFELVLYDNQKSTLGGLNNEFIFSPRLDNLTSCYAATVGLVDSAKLLSTSSGIQMISLFDHEEIGSVSAQGADSTFLPDILRRVTSHNFTDSGDHFFQSMARSFLLSSDMAHGVHPNYPEKYEGHNRPQVNQGPVIKVNANQRYATNSPGIVLIKKVADAAKVPLQLFVVRNDSPCGSTIGPILSAKLGIRTLDLGNPQLSMHSIRETGGTYDVVRLVDLFKVFFERYQGLEEVIGC